METAVKRICAEGPFLERDRQGEKGREGGREREGGGGRAGESERLTDSNAWRAGVCSYERYMDLSVDPR